MVVINPISKYPILPEALYIRDLLQRTLDRTVEIYDSYNVPLPTRRYWCLGQAAEDCAQVTVVFLSATLGLPGAQQQEPMNCTGPKFATIQVNVTRDIPQGPNGNPATPEKLQEASNWMAIDAALLIDNLQQYATTAFGAPGSALATVTTPAPNGFLQTTTLTLTVGML